MIVRSHRVNICKLLLACQGSVVPAITWKIVAAALVGTAAELIINHELIGSTASQHLQFTMQPFTALGVAISLFLGFYNNAAFARWWEARGYWGRQIIIIRNLARFLMLLESGDVYPTSIRSGEGLANPTTPPKQMEIDDDFDVENRTTSVNNQMEISSAVTLTQSKTSNWRHDVIRLSIAQTHALRAQLRPECKFDGSTTALDDRNRFLSAWELQNVAQPSRNPANAILLHAARILGAAYRQSMRSEDKKDSSVVLDSYTMVHIAQQLELLSDMQTSCERIHNTPLPLAYSLLIQRTTVLYVALLPFAIAEGMGWWTPVFTAFVAYTFFGLDELARQIQEPFGDEPMCLALSAMSRCCEIDALEAMGEIPPPPLKRQGKTLM